MILMTTGSGLRTVELAALLLVGAGGCQRTRPPAADCGAVAELLVSLELGNYAAPEERAATLPAKRALCEQQRISADEAACLAKATDTWSAGDCLPRMFPRAERGECEPVVAKLRAVLTSAGAGSPNAVPMVEKVLAVLARSCAEDAWPEELRRCILAAPTADPSAFDGCEQVTPPALRAKLEARMRQLAL